MARQKIGKRKGRKRKKKHARGTKTTMKGDERDRIWKKPLRRRGKTSVGSGQVEQFAREKINPKIVWGGGGGGRRCQGERRISWGWHPAMNHSTGKRKGAVRRLGTGTAARSTLGG